MESHREPSHRVISLGGGVQSTVVLLIAGAGGFGEVPDVAIFADTGWEPASVYRHLEWLEEVSEIPVVRVSSGRNLRHDAVSKQSKSGRPSLPIPIYLRNPDGSLGMSMNRACTDRYKLRPIEKYVRQEMLDLQPGQRVPSDVLVETWLGISREEVLRVRESRHRWGRLVYPLIDMAMNRRDCAEWFADRHPGRNLPRSACSGCPFRSDSEWLRLKQTDPKDFEDAVEVDAAIRETGAGSVFRGEPFLNARRKPLGEAVQDYEQELAMNPMLPGLSSGSGNECEGVCFV